MRVVTWMLLPLIVGIFLAIPSEAADPATPPSIPSLIFPTEQAHPFVVDGLCRASADHGFGFHLATDGTRQLCVLFDLQDGTPIYLSDGQQTLVYDLANSRVVRVPNSRLSVSVDWNQENPKPLKFNFDFEFTEDSKKLAGQKSFFRIDRFVRAYGAALQPIASDNDTESFAFQRATGTAEVVQVPRGELNWFRFTSCRAGDNYYGMLVEARLGTPPPATLLFPELTALGREIKVIDLDKFRSRHQEWAGVDGKSGPRRWRTDTEGDRQTPLVSRLGKVART